MTIPEPPPGPPAPPERRNGCLTAFMALVGIILLLPGLCALIAGLPEIAHTGRLDGIILTLFAVTFAIGALGIWLLRVAFRPPRP